MDAVEYLGDGSNCEWARLPRFPRSPRFSMLQSECWQPGTETWRTPTCIRNAHILSIGLPQQIHSQWFLVQAVPGSLCGLSLSDDNPDPLRPLTPLRGPLCSPIAGAPNDAPPRHFHVLEHYPDERLPRRVHDHLLPNRPHPPDSGHRLAEFPLLPQIPPAQSGSCLGPNVSRGGHHLLLRTEATKRLENRIDKLLRRGAGHGQRRGFRRLHDLGGGISEKIRNQWLSAPL